MKIQKYIKRCQKRVNAVLKRILPPITTPPKELHKAMRYAVLNGGKRLRSSLLYATGEALGANSNLLNQLSAAIEIMHAFSLIHDDLPALDNDDLRRGKPTCHKIFGVARAILAGDALHSLGFEILANLNHTIPSQKKLEIIRIIAHAIGSKGMIGGEDLDLSMVGRSTTVKKLATMYQMKTGMLLSACVQVGALAANCQNKKILNALKKFSQCIGLVFQIHDDIIGLESDTKTLGKKQGADIILKKPVYPVLIGIDKAKEKEIELYHQAIRYLEKSGIPTTHLQAITAYIIERNL